MASKQGHFKLNPPPYVPGPVKFFGVPGDEGDIVTDEQQQAYNVVRGFGAQGAGQQKYVRFFFKGGGGVPGAYETYQLADIGKSFTLSASQAAAINHGTANTRAEFITGMKIAGGLDANNEPVDGVGGCQSTTVNVAKVGSLYAAICDSFQHNLNVGADGG
jgi:hypothetical protein